MLLDDLLHGPQCRSSCESDSDDDLSQDYAGGSRKPQAKDIFQLVRMKKSCIIYERETSMREDFCL